MTVPQRLRLFGLALIGLGLAGCHSMPTSSADPTVVSVASVIDLIRGDLAIFMATVPETPAKPGACYQPSGNGKGMNLVPVKMTVTLKAISLRENDPSVGLKAPLGILSIDPSFSGAYSNARTQTLVVPLTVPTAQEKSLLASSPSGEHALADALNKFRQEILNVNHNQLPCLKFSEDGKSNFKLSLAFDIVNKTTVGLGLQLAVFKIGDKQIFVNEAHQTLDIELALVGSDDGLMIVAPQ